MKTDNFNVCINGHIEYCLNLLEEKSKEYTFGDDRLEHFKNAAAEQDTTPKKALWGMLSKHLTSLNGMCKNDSDSIELWVEKIGDSINYLLLLRALVAEELEHE